MQLLLKRTSDDPRQTCAQAPSNATLQSTIVESETATVLYHFREMAPPIVSALDLAKVQLLTAPMDEFMMANPPPRAALLPKRAELDMLRRDPKSADAPPPTCAVQSERMLLRMTTTPLKTEATPPPLPAKDEALEMMPGSVCLGRGEGRRVALRRAASVMAENITTKGKRKRAEKWGAHMRRAARVLLRGRGPRHHRRLPASPR